MEDKKKVTQVEYDKKLKKFEHLKTKLSSISKAKIASAYSDPGNTWHDNFAYEQLDLQEDGLLTQLENLQKDIQNSQVIVRGNVSPGRVDIYDKIKMLFTYDDGEQESLVLTLGNDDGENSISLSSPLGSLIYNKKYGEVVEYFVNNKKVQVKIIKKVN